MKKRLLSLILTACMLLGMLPGTVLAAEPTAWDGTAITAVTPADNVYTIKTGAELAWVAQQVNAGTNTFSGKTVVLGANIDLGNQQWTPIGSTTQRSFRGSFDGGGFTISGLAVGTSVQPYTGQYAGLFGYIATPTPIAVKDVTVKGAVYSKFTPTSSLFPYAGLLAGAMTCSDSKSSASLTNCHAVGTVEMTVNETGSSLPMSFLSAGGLAGNTNFVVDSCSATSTDSSPDTALVTLNLTYAGNMKQASVGGLLGEFSGKLYNSWSIGAVTAKDATASTTGQSGTLYLGGMVGYLGEAKVENSFARTTISSTGYAASGPIRQLGNFSGNGTGTKVKSSYAVATKAGSTDYSNYDASGTVNAATDATVIKAAFNEVYNATLDTRNSARPRPVAAYSTWATDAGTNGGLPTLTGTKPFTPDWVDEGQTAELGRDYEIADKTITIKTEKGLGWLVANAATYYSGYDPYYCYKGYTILLAADLDLSDKPWIPVGTKLITGDKAYIFAGMFDGQGHTITGLQSNVQDNQWMFPANVGTVLNLGLRGGGLAKTHGESDDGGTILNCWVSNATGALAGNSVNGTIVNSFGVNSGTGSGQYFGNVNSSVSGQEKTAVQLKDAAFAALLSTTAQSLTNQRPTSAPRALFGWVAVTDKHPAFGTVLTATKDWVDVVVGAPAVKGTDYAIDGDTYTIKTAKGLAWLSGVSLGAIGTDAPKNPTFKGKTVVLAGDINLSGHNWAPIGANTGYSGPTAVFSGTFDGQGHKISDLTINNNVGINDSTGGFAAAGLFGAVDNAVIRNVTVENPAIALSGGNYKAGALVGELFSNYYGSQVDNCHVIGGTISAASDAAMNIGGLVGCSLTSQTANSSVSATTALTMTVTGGDTSLPNHSVFMGKNLGGLIGDSEHETSDNCILNSWSRAILKAEGSNAASFSVGGIAGAAFGETITNNYFAGSIAVAAGLTATDAKCVGGIVGYDHSTGSTFTNNFYLTGTAATGIGYKNSQNPADVTGQTDAKSDADLKNAILLNNAPAMAAVAAAVESAKSGAVVRYWKADGALNDGYPIHKTPESFTKQPTTDSLSVVVTNATGATYAWEKQLTVNKPYENTNWKYDAGTNSWKAQSPTSTVYNADMAGFINSDAGGKVTAKWAVKSGDYADLSVRLYTLDGTRVGQKFISGTHETLTEFSIENLTPNTQYKMTVDVQLTYDTEKFAQIQFSQTQRMYSTKWEVISGQTAATLNPTGIAKDTLVRCIATYLWGETITSDTAKVGEAPASCTCTLSAPTFASGNIEIAHNAANATQALSATGSALSGTCSVSGHAGTAVTYTYAKKTDANNIASVSGTTLTVTGAGTVVVTATASANGKSNSTDATFTVTKAAAPAVSYTVTFDSQGATTAADPTTKTVTAPATTVVTLPTPPVKTGSTFGGWFTAANGAGTVFTADTTVTGNITVYAKWTADVPPVTDAEARWGTDDNYAVGSGTFADAISYADSLTSGTAYIQLLKDVNPNGAIAINGKVSLDLNGKTLNSQVLIGATSESAALTVKDTGIGGKITKSDYPTLMVYWDDTLTVQSGKIENTGTTQTCAVMVAGELYLTGTPVLTGTASEIDKYDGANVVANDGTQSPVYYGGETLRVSHRVDTQAAGKVLVSGLENAEHAKKFTFANPQGNLVAKYDDASKSLKLKQAVASMTTAGNVTTKYATIGEAFAAANGATGSTLKLLSNCTSSAALTASGNFILDLNDFELTAQVKVNGTLTVKDTGTDSEKGVLHAESGAAVQVTSGGTFKLESGKLRCSNNSAQSVLRIEANGTAELKDGILEHNAIDKYAISMAGTLKLSGSPVLADGIANIATGDGASIVANIGGAPYAGEEITIYYSLGEQNHGDVLVSGLESAEQAKNFIFANPSAGLDAAYDDTAKTLKMTYKSYPITYKDGGNTDYTGSNGDNLTKAHTYNTATTLVDGVKTGYIFGGWFTDSGCSEGNKLTTLGATAFTEEITLYAKWTEVFDVGGDVTDDTNAAVANATVKLMLGKDQIGTDKNTDAQGKFTFTDVPTGVYNLVITHGGQIVTRISSVTANTTVDTVKLPKGTTNSVVEVKDDIPVVVGGLDEQFTQEEKTFAESANNSVTIKLTVEKKAEHSANNANDIKLAVPDTKKLDAYLDLSVLKTTVTNSIPDSGEAMAQTLTLLEIRVPLTADQLGKTGYAVYRYHVDKVDTLTNVHNADGEYIEVVAGTLILHVKKFSTYAIAFDKAVDPIPPPPPIDTGSSSVTTYAITATAGEGGSISPKGTVQVNRNGSKAFTITPDAGYEIADVLVDGKSVGVVASYTFEKVTAKHTIEAQFRKEVKNPFTDVNEENWFYDAVLGAYEKGLMEGVGDNRFAPDLNTDRATVVTTLWRLEGKPSKRESSAFPDVTADAWYADAVAWGHETGMVKGYDTGRFGPTDPITREQLVTILWRYAGSEAVLDYEGTGRFIDTEDISSWAAHAVTWALSKGILTGKGDGILDPGGKATRAEVAAMLTRFMGK